MRGSGVEEVEELRPTGLQLRRVERPVVSWTAARWRQGTSNLAGGGAWNEVVTRLQVRAAMVVFTEEKDRTFRGENRERKKRETEMAGHGNLNAHRRGQRLQGQDEEGAPAVGRS